ncbi:MAG: CRISPR-associated endonuclease Cas1 [Clostridia bacterium]|nr:CRISPR-associated endonuclease Cas1 [Clostridia bacterium]
MISKLFDEANIHSAIEHILQGKVKVDSRGMPIEDLPAYWLIHRDDIADIISNREYLPHTVLMRPLLQENGKERSIARLAATDMLLLRAICQILSPLLEPSFSSHSYAYRSGMSAADAVREAKLIMENGYPYALKMDIADFFASIDHDILLDMLQPYADDDLLYLIRTLLSPRCRDESTGQTAVLRRGLVLGSPLSPLLSNLYLTPLDRFLEEKGIPFVRYADDLTLFLPYKKDAAALLESVSAFLAGSLRLQLRPDKCEICYCTELQLLGFWFRMRCSRLEAVRFRNKTPTIQLDSWESLPLSGVCESASFLQNGILTRRHMALLYEGEQYRRLLPSAGLEALHLHADVLLSPDFLSFAAQQGIRLCYYNQYGHYIGSFIPAAAQAGNSCMLAQMRHYLSAKDRLYLARRFEHASLFNLYQNIRYYRERKNEALLEPETAILDAIDELRTAQSIETLMLIEARARQIYYSAFPLIITHPEFSFSQRSIRPPRDPVNAMISFGNTLLYQLVSDAIYSSRLDIRISLIHSAAGQRSENLHLDLADVFKPILVDRVIFSMINKRAIHADCFSSRPDGGVYLSRKGKQLFIRHMEDKLDQTITHSGKKMTYRQLIRDEVLSLQNYFEHGTSYRPYHYR